jgi:hypothetical protein
MNPANGGLHCFADGQRIEANAFFASFYEQCHRNYCSERMAEQNNATPEMALRELTVILTLQTAPYTMVFNLASARAWPTFLRESRYAWHGFRALVFSPDAQIQQ